MKRVRETKEFKSISAYYIYHPDGRRAQVEAHWSNAGICRVDVWQFDGSGLVHKGRAGGYGYDKFAAALAGAKIYGIEIFDHCGQDDTSKKLLAEYRKEIEKAENKIIRNYPASSTEQKHVIWKEIDNTPLREITEKYKKKLAKIGASFDNWSTVNNCYTSVYYNSGLDRLENFGFHVIQVV